MMTGTEILNQLSDKQLAVFTWLFTDIVNNLETSLKNAEIAKKVGVPESTLEKYLKHFEELKLIVRRSERGINGYTGRWETISRSITLNPEYFPRRILDTMRAVSINSIVEQIAGIEISAKIAGAAKAKATGAS
jgi:predicted AAA+ superfamily ATPase